MDVLHKTKRFKMDKCCEKLLFFIYFIVILLSTATFGSDNESTLNIHTYARENIKQFQSQKTTNMAIASNHLIFKALDTPFHYQYSPSERTLRMMEQGKSICITNRLKTPAREKLYYFSKPTSIFLSHQLYLLPKLKPIPPDMLNSNGEIKSLPLLFSHYTEQKLYVGKTDSYGEFFDQQIKQLLSRNIYLRSGSTAHHRAKLKMFEKERIDFILEYPSELHSFVQEETKLQGYSIAGSPSYIKNYWVCSKTKQGLAMIQHLNKAISSIYNTPEHIDAHIRLSSPSSHKKLLQHYHEVFDQK